MSPITLYIDADACPVKAEVYRVAERHAGRGTTIKVFVVSNSPIAVPRDAMIERVVVGAGMDEADNWIAERAGPADIVITADVPLASRAVKAGATVIAPNGRPFTEESIGMTLATRNLMDSLRSSGEITGGPKPFAPRDRSEFLSALDRALVRLVRAGFGRATG
ncbi:MAG: YaiI/YqxD family protein [Xanthobacteraceae bacterium]